MAKILVSEALKLVPVKKTALYSDIKKGVLSAEKDSRGRKVVDTAELERVYGTLKNPNTNGKQNGTPRTEPNGTGNANGGARTEADTHGNANEVSVLKAQIEFLTTSLEKSETRAEELKEDKKEIGERLAEAHKMLSTEQEKTRLLMLPNSEQAERKEKGWLLRLVGAR